MNRSEIIKKLVREGMSEKTLASFSDKQIMVLANRMINEDVMVSKKDPQLTQKVAAAKKTGKTIETYESKKPNLSNKQRSKMDTDKDGDIDAKDLKTLRSKKQSVEEKKKPSAGLTAKKKSEVVKAAKAGKDIGKKGKGFEKIASTAAKKYGSAEKGKKVAAAAMWKNVKRENVEVKNWLKMLAEENFHSFTSKGEIMELIQAKTQKNVMPDFFKSKAIKSSGRMQQTNEGDTTTKPKTKPTTKPGTKPGKPKRDNPFSPKPQPNPAPQAESAPATKPKTKPTTKPTTKPGKPKRDNPFSPKPQPNPAPQAENKKIGTKWK